jgi:predicted AlkP superfamily phosphohydrolase/phosphomutase
MFTGRRFSSIEAFGLVNLDTTYKNVPVTPMKWKNLYVWDILSRNNITVGIFSLPFLHHSYKVNGFMITDPVLGDDMYPPNVIPCIAPGQFNPQQEKGVRWRIFYQKPALFKQLVEKTHYDFYFFLISVSDVMMHLGDEKELFTAYKEIDQKILPLIQKLCATYGYSLFIVSDHGSKKTYKKFNINSFLKKKGYLKTDEPHFKGVLTHGIQKMISVLPVTMVRTLRDIYLKVIASRGTTVFPRICYEKSTAFGGGAGNTSYCGVWLNKKGIFNQGIVDIDDQEILKNLLNDLQEAEEIEHVYTREDLGYSKSTVFPDIVIKTKDEFAVYYPVFPSVVHHSEEVVHSQYGVIIASGQHIRNTTVEGARIQDIAPTILHFFDVPIPEMDGRVLTEIFEGAIAETLPVYVNQPTSKKEIEYNKIKKAVESQPLKKLGQKE